MGNVAKSLAVGERLVDIPRDNPDFHAGLFLDAIRPVQPADIVELAAKWKIGIVSAPLAGRGYLLRFPDDTYEIMVRQDQKRDDWEFTIAHELGHYAVELTTGALSRLPGTSYLIGRGTPNELEEWCDGFAKKLLASMI